MQWIDSFLEDRQNFVEIEGTKSSVWSVLTGVIQGGILSPDLYNIGAISQSFWSEISKSIIFADDGIEVISGDTKEETEIRLK